MTQFDVIGFGALNVDKLFKVDRIAGKEEESRIFEYQESCGGSAANTIIGLARLGLRVGFLGEVVADYEGQLLLEDFKREHVDTEGIIVAERGQSGVVMGFVDKEGERALYVSPGVNDSIDFAKIDFNYASRTSLLHLSSFVGEKSFEAQKKLVEKLSNQAKISFDPGMLYAKKGLSALKAVVKHTFAILPNEIELKLLTGKEYEDGAKILLTEGAKIVAVKLGKRGCFITNSRESHLVKPFKVKTIDTTGAGDAWNAGFLYGIMKNKSLEECGRLGNFVASKCIMKIGARPGLPRLADLQRLNLR